MYPLFLFMSKKQKDRGGGVNQVRLHLSSNLQNTQYAAYLFHCKIAFTLHLLQCIFFNFAFFSFMYLFYCITSFYFMFALAFCSILNTLHFLFNFAFVFFYLSISFYLLILLYEALWVCLVYKRCYIIKLPCLAFTYFFIWTHCSLPFSLLYGVFVSTFVLFYNGFLCHFF